MRAKTRLRENVRAPKMVAFQRDSTLPRSLFYHTITCRQCCSDSVQRPLVGGVLCHTSLLNVIVLLGDRQITIFPAIQSAIAIIIRFSVSETKPSGTVLDPPTHAHFSSRRSM